VGTVLAAICLDSEALSDARPVISGRAVERARTVESGDHERPFSTRGIAARRAAARGEGLPLGVGPGLGRGPGREALRPAGGGPDLGRRPAGLLRAAALRAALPLNPGDFFQPLSAVMAVGLLGALVSGWRATPGLRLWL